MAIIPARGGSKRIPRKNIRPFLGEAMLVRTIKYLQKTGLFRDIYVSTDDEEIRGIGVSAGAKCLGLRPEEISGDKIPTAPVIKYEVERIVKVDPRISKICCVYPCTPTLNVDDLKEGLRFIQSGSDFAYPVTEYHHPVQRAMRRSLDGKMTFVNKENELLPTQSFEPLYHDAGMFYWGKIEAWLREGKMHTDGVGFPIPYWRVVDIDTEADWIRAELIAPLLD